MASKDKKSFFERITGSIRLDDDDQFEDESEEPETPSKNPSMNSGARGATHSESHSRKLSPQQASGSLNNWLEDDPAEGQLAVDVYQTSSHIVIKTMVAGVRREDLDITISRDMVTVKGKREEEHGIAEHDYFHKELYWGAFSRSIVLPHEIETDGADASENMGLLTIKLPKIDKEKQTKLKVMKAQGF
jgi:HSP20 family molecular chaperone IbpA